MIRTGRYSGYYGEDVVKIAISVGKPRWGGYQGECRELAPYGIHGVVEDVEVAKKLYMEQLERLGVKGIKAIFKKLSDEADGKDVILCCWENVSKGEECHRRWLAQYIFEQTGKTLFEAGELTKPKKEKVAKQEEATQLSMFEDYEIL